MQHGRFSALPRRSFVTKSLTVLAASALAVWGWARHENAAGLPPASSMQPTMRAPTPACGDTDDHGPTLEQTEGPYFTRNSPERASLMEPGIAGTRLIVAGTVLAADCTPVPHALLDFWQADDKGSYDNAGYRMRGHQFTDDTGHFSLETIIPGLYPGRTRHIHVKVQAANGPILTTQLYFPNEPRNGSDSIFDPLLIMDMHDAAESKQGAFTFVVNT